MTWAERRLLAEALVVLVVASVVIRVVPFRRIVALCSRTVRGPAPPPARRAWLARKVPWAARAWSRRVPWRALCFEQGLTTHLMLRRRGVPTVLHYGAATDAERGLIAHVWICDDDRVIIGGEGVERFGLLARFPS